MTIELTQDVDHREHEAQTQAQSDRILSIQSHVAFGYVGGKAAVFPLQCMGYDVDVVNTVNFSNHTGYGRFGGTRTNGEELTRMFDSMQQSGALEPDRLLTGYIPNANALGAVCELVKKLKISNPNLIYLLDPVLGDSGSLYVSQDCIPVYRQLLSQATIITPNWFEVEVLTEAPLTDLASLRTALQKLHRLFGVPNVVISSIPLAKLSISIPSYLLAPSHPTHPTNQSAREGQSYLICLASSINDNEDPQEQPLSTVYAGCVERIPGQFTGVGDLFSALLIGNYHPPQGGTSPSRLVPTKPYLPLAHAASHSLSRTHAIITLTHKSASALSLSSTDDELDAREPERICRRMKGRELRIIQGQDVFRRKKWEGVEMMRVWEGFWNDPN